MGNLCLMAKIYKCKNFDFEYLWILNFIEKWSNFDEVDDFVDDIVEDLGTVVRLRKSDCYQTDFLEQVPIIIWNFRAIVTKGNFDQGMI